MVEDIKIVANQRLGKGSSAARRSRRAGKVPAIMYGTTAPLRLELVEHDLGKVVSHHSSEHIMLNIAIENMGDKRVLVKEIQRHPVTGAMLHVDLLEVEAGKLIKLEVSVDVIGIPVGVTIGGGTMEVLLNEVEVECMPRFAIESVALDVSALEVGEHITAGQLDLDPEKYQLITPADFNIVTVAAPTVKDDEEAETV